MMCIRISMMPKNGLRVRMHKMKKHGRAEDARPFYCALQEVWKQPKIDSFLYFFLRFG